MKRKKRTYRPQRRCCSTVKVENPVTVIVVSNRVARAKSDEPVAGGLAAALIPMVKNSGAIWGGSSGQTSDYAASRDCFSQIEPLGTGPLATVDMPPKHYR